jgi:outer membrane autotransporter protein
MNGFTETNSGLPSTIGLSYAARTIPSVPAYVGAQVDAKTVLDNKYSLYGWMRAAWVHEFEPHRSIDASFIAAPGFGFVIQGAQQAPDMAKINTGVKLNVSDHLSLSASFNANLAPTAQSYSGFGGLRVAW